MVFFLFCCREYPTKSTRVFLFKIHMYNMRREIKTALLWFFLFSKSTTIVIEKRGWFKRKRRQDVFPFFLHIQGSFGSATNASGSNSVSEIFCVVDLHPFFRWNSLELYRKKVVLVDLKKTREWMEWRKPKTPRLQKWRKH